MGEENGLGALGVRVARRDGAPVARREGDERLLEPPDRAVERVALGAQPEAKVERHLVVAAAAGVQLAAERPEELHEPPLDRHVDVLVRGEKAEAARIELAADGPESPFEPRALAARQQPRTHERAD